MDERFFDTESEPGQKQRNTWLRGARPLLLRTDCPPSCTPIRFWCLIRKIVGKGRHEELLNTVGNLRATL